MGMRRLAARFAAGAAGFGLAQMLAVQASAADLVGQPTKWGMGLQPGVTPLRDSAASFHNYILLPMCIIISAFVLVLLLWCVIRYNKKSNPTPAKWSHNTFIEVVWTVVPVLILMGIAVISFRLLVSYHEYPKATDGSPGKPDITIKATGYQWQWGYEYPDQGIKEFIANVLPEDQAKAKNVPYLLAATKPIVVPVNKTVRVLVTGADVIHAFAVPAFGIIIDAIPGRVNETWFRAEKEGIYYGNCRELCGVDHAFMPIEVHVVSQQAFDEWTVAQGGKTAAMAAADAAAAKVKAEADAAAKAATDAAAKVAAPAAAPGAAAPAAAGAATPAVASMAAAPAGSTASKPASTPAVPAPAPAKK
jgi:cytochrome c oxidase subunit 2